MDASQVLGQVRIEVSREASEDAAADLAALYDAHGAPLYRYLLALLSNVEDAEDALQEVFLGVLRRAAGDSVADVRAYLFRAARNQALMALRKRRKQDKERAAAAISWIEPESCGPDQRGTAIDIDRAVRELAVEQREVILLKVSEGLTFREIAEVIGVPHATAASRYRLALARLRRLLEGGDDDD